jgi:hexosaminidase
MAEKVRVGFLHQPSRWIFAPRSVEILISLDGKAYKSRGKLNTQESWRELPHGVKTYEILMRDQPVRYVKVIAQPLPGGPAGHPSAGEPVWVMADEVWVE